jgi:CRP/FNR family transcriptional regulator, cyclic AMP receptor protein
MSDRETVDFLATVPLFEGQDEENLAQLARVMRRRTVREGEVLWRQGDDAREALFVVDGTVSLSLRVARDRTVEISRAGPGEMLGEIALLDGHGHTLSARVTETASLLALGRLDFTALLVAQHPTAFGLRRRLASHLTARLRSQLRDLAVSLGVETDGLPNQDAAPDPADLEQCKAPDSRYVRRMATFSDFDPLALWGFLTPGKYVRCPPRRTLVAEGAPSNAYYLTINGAVEKVLIRDDRRIRVGLAGPGMAFGYEGLIDGRPSPVAAITRERTLLLVLPRNVFDQLFHREDAVARVFLEAIQRDLLVSLRQALRPGAHLAASV